MEDRADFLCRRIALYRRYLREGVDVSLAEVYLQQIAADEAGLAGIEGTKKQWPSISSSEPHQRHHGCEDDAKGGDPTVLPAMQRAP